MGVEGRAGMADAERGSWRYRRGGSSRRLTVPWVGAEAARTGGTRHGHHGDDSGKLLFFASDGLRQDARRGVRRDGDTPGFRELLQQGHEGLGQRPADPGAAEHRRRLVHARDRRVAGRPRLDQQHVPHQRHSAFGTAELQPEPHDGVRPRRAAGRDARPGGRARRQEGRPDRVGGRPRRRDQRPDARLPQLPLRPRRGDELHRARGLAEFTRSFGLQFDHPAGFAGNAPFPQAAPTDATGWTNVPRSYSPAKEMRLRVLDGDANRRRQVRPQRLHLRQPQRRQDAL